MTAALAVEHVVVLQRHVAHRHVVGRHRGQVAVRAADLEQAGQPGIGLLGGQGVPVAVVPVQPVRHVGRYVVGVGVAHPGGDVEQHVVGVAARADVHAVGVQVQRRRAQGRRVQRNLPAGLGEGRIVEVGDLQVLQVVVEVHDEPLPGVDPQGRGRIQVVPGSGAVRAAALDQRVAEHQEVRHRLGHRVEIDAALVRRQPHLQDAVLARQPDRLAERGRAALRIPVARAGHPRSHQRSERQQRDDPARPRSHRRCQITVVPRKMASVQAAITATMVAAPRSSARLRSGPAAGGYSQRFSIGLT